MKTTVDVVHVQNITFIMKVILEGLYICMYLLVIEWIGQDYHFSLRFLSGDLFVF